MTFLKTLVFGFTAALSFAVLSCESVNGQLSVEEVYKLDVVAEEKGGVSEKAMARYFINMGLKEQSRLASKAKRRGGGLDDESLQRKIMLDEVLAPVNLMIKSGSLNSESWNKLLSDEKTYRNVFSAIGGERATELASESVVKNLIARSEGKRVNAYSPVSFLNSDAVARYLSLTESQKLEIESLIESTTEKMRFGSKDDFSRLELLQKSHWEKLLQTLDSKQRSLAKAIIGEPVQWFRNASMEKFRSRDFSAGGRTAITSDVESISTSDGRSVYQMSRDELETHGVDFVYSHLLEMFQHPFVWDELELSDEQRKQAKETTFRKKTIVVSGQHQNRLAELLTQKADLPKFTNMLSEEQAKWFKQLELQILTNKYASSVSLIHPGVKDRLAVSASQATSIQALADNYNNEASAMIQKIRDERLHIQQDFVSDVEAVLTTKQKALFDKLLGQEAAGRTK